MEQNRKAYNEKQAGIRSSAPYDWSVQTCTEYSGVTKHIFHNVLKEPYCTKDQSDSYGIPSELGAFVCAYAYAVKSYKECSEKNLRLAPHLRKFFEKHREILHALEKEQRGEYERYVLGSNPDFQFLSSYSSFLDRFSDKIAILFSIINDFPAENRLQYMQRILSTLDAEIENIILERQQFYNDTVPEPPKKDNLSLKMLFHDAYKRNSWRKNLNELFEHTNALLEFQEYAKNIPAIFARSDRPKKDENGTAKIEELRLAAERAYHQELIKEFLSEDEILVAERFLKKQYILESDEIKYYEQEIRIFLYIISTVLSTQPVLERFPLTDTTKNSKISIFDVYEIGEQILLTEDFNIADAALTLIMADLPIYLKRKLSNILDVFQKEFYEHHHALGVTQMTIYSFERQTDSSYHICDRKIAPKLYKLLTVMNPGLDQMSVSDAVAKAENSLLQQKVLKYYYQPLFKKEIINGLHQNYVEFVSALSSEKEFFSGPCIIKLLTYLRFQHVLRAADFVERYIIEYRTYYTSCRDTIRNTIDPLKSRDSYQAFEEKFHDLMYQMLFSDDQFEITEDALSSK